MAVDAGHQMVEPAVILIRCLCSYDANIDSISHIDHKHSTTSWRPPSCISPMLVWEDTTLFDQGSKRNIWPNCKTYFILQGKTEISFGHSLVNCGYHSFLFHFGNTVSLISVSSWVIPLQLNMLELNYIEFRGMRLKSLLIYFEISCEYDLTDKPFYITNC